MSSSPSYPGILIPIPQYPLYSAALDEYGLGQCHYYLNEDKNWSLDIGELHRAYKEHSKKYFVRGLVIINPGNPTGQVSSSAFTWRLVVYVNERILKTAFLSAQVPMMYAPPDRSLLLLMAIELIFVFFFFCRVIIRY